MKTLLKYFSMLFVLLICSNEQVFAQLDMSINGVGRGIVTNNHLSGDILNGDTASSRKGLSGYFLFDMGVNGTKGRELKVNTILRLRQPWGEFWGETNPFEFRQLQISGDLRWLHYELGDIDVEQTAYTVFNSNETYHQFESDMFKARRDIVEYENFNKGNMWRLQGIKLGTVAYLNRNFLKEVHIKGYGVRTDASNDANTPDRLLVGGTVSFLWGEGHKTNFNYSGLLDVPLDNYLTNYKNNVFSINFENRLLNKEKYKLFLIGEAGFSNNNYYQLDSDSTYKKEDYFYDVNLQARFNKGIKVKAGYKNVGMWFSSPAAQTVRVNVDQPPLLFGSVYNNTASRQQLLYDRFTQEQIYNRRLTPVLQNYIPFYGNITPYGDATPNRKGFTAGVSNDENTKFQFNLTGKMMSEVQAVGSAELRNFLGVYGGFRVGINELIGSERAFKFSLGGQYEKTTRNAGNIDLSSMITDAGVSYNILRSCDFLLGVKYVTAKGQEVTPVRNSLNEVINYTPYDLDRSETILSTGIKLNFNEFTNFWLTYNLVGLNDKKANNTSYQINQLFMNFNLTF